VGTILSFSTQGADPRRAAPRTATGAEIAEIIVFPRTGIRALRRWSEEGAIGADRAIEAPPEKDPA
jgi:hypothetical protein